jgi:nucleoside-diphosphate-sugar epimerase
MSLSNRPQQPDGAASERGRAPAPHETMGLAGRAVLVTGATGFIGRRVVRALVRAGSDVVATGRNAEVLAAVQRAYGVRTAISDLAHDAELVRLISDARPDVVFNLAGYGVARTERDPATAARMNGEVPGTIARTLASLPATTWSGQRLIHTGSALEYGSVGGSLAETGPAEPSSLYGSTKLQGTRTVAAISERTGIRALTARLFTVYGAGERPERLVPSLIRAAAGTGPVALTEGVQKRDFAFVDEVADGLLRLAVADAVPGEVVNVASGELTTVRAFTERAAAVLGIASERLLFGALPTRADEIAHDPVSIGRLRELTEWFPALSIEDGVERTVAELHPIPSR